ncbi:Phytochrome-like protein cph1 [Caulifigura coniformis]|uniref:histidine kinase n=2 Tax=Caulifigura coniformis TaxID=2527983 RepID=A0A517SKH0_9PLAN|nr:Phytochrome-like protein cph1 [Caulifigura coniformis]
MVMTPGWIIVAMTDSYLRTTMTRREDMVGRHALEVFPENPDDTPQRHPDDPTCRGAEMILESMQRVIDTGTPELMPFHKYDIRRPQSEGGEYEEHYWSIMNSPIFGADGKVEFVVHRVEDVTTLVRSRESALEQERRSAALEQRASHLELDVAIRSAELQKANRELHQTNVELNAVRADLERRVELRTADLKRRNQALEEIAYAASHDLQEPLRAVAGYCQLLLMDYAAALPAEAADYLQKAAVGAHRMSAMIRGILQFARMPKDTQSFSSIDANTVLAETLISLESAISESHATIVPGDLPTICSDPVLLTQVFQNLIGNSIKYCGERPPVIRIDAQKTGQEWVFSVADKGIGIPADSRDRVFAIFQRLKSPGSVPGTGIGLSLCRQIVEHHGGRIWIEGEPGEGTTVRFTIPIRDA